MDSQDIEQVLIDIWLLQFYARIMYIIFLTSTAWSEVVSCWPRKKIIHFSTENSKFVLQKLSLASKERRSVCIKGKTSFKTKYHITAGISIRELDSTSNKILNFLHLVCFMKIFPYLVAELALISSIYPKANSFCVFYEDLPDINLPLGCFLKLLKNNR